MIERYKYTERKNRRYNTTRYSIPPKNSADKYIFAREGDRLDNLANEFYEDPRLWWILAEANELGKGSMKIPPGKQIRIPSLQVLSVDEAMKRAERNK